MKIFKKLGNRSLLILLVLLLSLTFFIGCAGPEEPAPEPSDNDVDEVEEVAEVLEIPIAIVEPISGPIAFAGLPSVRAAEIAIDEINERGGIASLGNAKLVLNVYDGESTPEGAQSAAERAVRDGNVMILGCAHGASAELVTRVAERNQIVNIVTLASPDSLTQRGFEYIYRVMPSTSQQLISDLEFISSLEGVEDVVILYEDTAYGQDAVEQYKEFLDDFELTLLDTMAYPHEAPDLTSVVARVRSHDPDFIIVAGYEKDSILLMETMREQDYLPKGLLGKAFHTTYVDTLGKDGDYVFSTAWWTSNADPPGAPEGRSQQVVEEYRDRYGENMPDIAVMGFTAAMVAADVLERAGSLETADLLDAVRSTQLTGADGNLMLTERVEFTENGDNKFGRTLVSQMIDGEQHIVYPVEFADLDMVFPMPSWRER